MLHVLILVNITASVNTIVDITCHVELLTLQAIKNFIEIRRCRDGSGKQSTHTRSSLQHPTLSYITIPT